MQYFQPNLVKQNGIFNYIISTYSSNFSWFITLSAHPRNGFCELYTAIFEDKYTRFLTPNGEDPDIFIHLNEYKVKITHFAIHYTESYCYTKAWNIYDNTNGKHDLIGSINIGEMECGTDVTCNSNFIKIVPTIKQPLIDTLHFDTGLRSDGYNIAEFKSIEIYGYLFHNYAIRTCEQQLYYIKHYIFVFIFLLFSNV